MTPTPMMKKGARHHHHYHSDQSTIMTYTAVGSAKYGQLIAK